MIELDVPFIEKDQAKAVGARWDPAIRKWYIPEGVSPQSFARWLPDDFVYDTELKSEDELTLGAYLVQIQAVIANNIAKNTWIVAEVSECRINRGHMYLTLVEHDDSGRMIAKVSAKCWSDTATRINAKFLDTCGQELSSGIKILVNVNAEFHPQYGMSLGVNDVDPNFTVGDMAAKLAAIREELVKLNIYDLNKQYNEPYDYTNVAVISPKDAAGLGDFNQEAKLLVEYSLCTFKYFSAIFQGEKGPASILDAIQEMLAEHAKSPFDAVVIIRGGGAVADLAWLNDLNLAKAICNLPLHVMCGIGHERDSTIIDEIVANRFSTPSKVSNRIYNTITSNAMQALQNFNEIKNSVHNKLLSTKTAIDGYYSQLNLAANNYIDIFAMHLNQANTDIKEIAKNSLTRVIEQVAFCNQYITDKSIQIIDTKLDNLATMKNYLQIYANDVVKLAETDLKFMISEILNQDPKKVLERGFVIVKSNHGEVLSTRAQAVKQPKINLTFSDGTLEVINEL